MPRPDFPSFEECFEAVNDIPPFAWQSRLAHESANGAWPGVIAAPTGAGKTAILDIAIYNLAKSLACGGPRTAPMRIIFAVDRRIIVDQAYERAKKIRTAIDGANGGPLAVMRAALKHQTNASALHVAALRGGIPREDDWARTPGQATVLCTTVDQLGSRLLFRGYGVSPRMSPVHAGLLGQDALIILDEAHMSQAFVSTLGRIGKLRKGSVQLPWAVTQLTATPIEQTDSVFRLTDKECDQDVIAARLNASKPAQLIEVKYELFGDDHANELMTQAVKLAGATKLKSPTIAIVVNRVNFARRVFDAFGKDPKAILLTGRVRPAERDQLIGDYGSRLMAGRSAEADEPLFVVATQCIEAGADFDFDGMVTQIAPLDSLRQRFGRLNRVGDRPHARAIIVAAAGELAKKFDDPVYGDRARITWEFLESIATQVGKMKTVDFGVAAMATSVQAHAEAAARCIAPVKDAPFLRAADMDFLAMTEPRPSPDPHLPLFLHGDPRIEMDVSIVWRADLDQQNKDRWQAIVALMPPRAAEALQVPLWAARRWLAEASEGSGFGDAGPVPGEDAAGPPKGKPCLRWAGATDDRTGLASGNALRPGQTIIVPASYGGCNRFGWAPAFKEPAADIADAAAAPYAARQIAIRVKKHCSAPAVVGEARRASLLALLKDGGEPRLRDVKTILDGAGISVQRIECPYDDRDDAKTGFVIVGTGRGANHTAEAVTDDDDLGSLTIAQTLTDHSAQVEAQARDFAAQVGLDARLTETVSRAARWHDNGKADPRFQTYLKGHDDGPVMAKTDRRTWAEDKAMRQESGLPEKWRHEVLSARLAAQTLHPEDPEIDARLALYLIGVHHGYGRPFFPHTDGWDAHARDVNGRRVDPGPGPEALDFEWHGYDWPGLFADLRKEYGEWGLAYLEAFVRLADHRASEAAEKGAPT